MPALTLTTTLPLPQSSHRIPHIGFGVWTSRGPTCTTSCLAAFRAGYTQIDSAQLYANESQVGAAVLRSGIPRSQLYLTTKIAEAGKTPEETYARIVESVGMMSGGVEGGYVDLFLIHGADVGRVEVRKMWVQLERARREGLCRDIGVSNAGRGHVEAMREYAEVWPPAVNQIELHPWCQQREAVEYCRKHGIVVQAYCPLVRNQKADDPTLNRVADKCGKSTAQVLIRYCLQKGWVPLPKSDTPSRIEGNVDVYDFEISEEDMKALDDLDEGAKGAICEAVDNEAE